MARRLLSIEAVLEELEVDDDFDVDEPMMAGSDNEFKDFEDVYLEDVENDDDDDSNGAAPPNPLPVTHKAQAQAPSLPGLPLLHPSPSLPSAHQWVLRSTSQSHQLTPLTSRLRLIFWMIWCSRPTCTQRR